MAMLGHGETAHGGVHVKITAHDAVNWIANIKPDLRPVPGQHKIRDAQRALRAAHMHPLLQFCNEGAIKPGGDTAVEQQLPRELRRNRGWTILAPLLRQEPARDQARELKLHRPKGKANAIPPQIAQTAERLQFAMRTDVVGEKIRWRAET